MRCRSAAIRCRRTEADALLRQFRQQNYPNVAAFRAALEKYGLTEDELKHHLSGRWPRCASPSSASVWRVPTPPAQSADRVTMVRRRRLPKADEEDEMDAWLKQARSGTRFSSRREPSNEPRTAVSHLWTGGGLLGLDPRLFVAGIAIVRTDWFREYGAGEDHRHRGRGHRRARRVGSFNFDWTHLRAKVRNFVLHGLEPAGARRCSAPICCRSI